VNGGKKKQMARSKGWFFPISKKKQTKQTKICANILVGNLLHYVISRYQRNELSTVYEPVSPHFIK
jgi:hypothetical protein